MGGEGKGKEGDGGRGERWVGVEGEGGEGKDLYYIFRSFLILHRQQTREPLRQQM